MPNFYIYNGKANSKLRDWLTKHKDKTIKVTTEVETPKVRLRDGFHALLNAWYKSGEYSVDVKTLAGLKRYYKFVGCNWETAYFEYRGEEFKTGDDLHDAYPDFIPEQVTRQPKHWEDMRKDEMCISLDTMRTEILNSGCNNNAVMRSLALLDNDIEMLKWLKWYDYQADKQVNRIANKFNGRVM